MSKRRFVILFVMAALVLFATGLHGFTPPAKPLPTKPAPSGQSCWEAFKAWLAKLFKDGPVTSK